MILHYITVIAISAIIGWLTNYLAIKMLFHPYQPKKYFLGFQGIIPKNKSRLAQGISKSVGGQILNQEAFEKTLLSQEIKNKIVEFVEQTIQNLKKENPTIIEKTYQFFGTDSVDNNIQKIKNNIANTVREKLSDKSLSQSISAKIIEIAKEKLNNNIFGGFISGFIEGYQEKIENYLNEYLSTSGCQMVNQMIENQINQILNKNVEEFDFLSQENIQKIKDFVLAKYENLIKNKLSQILQSVNIQEIIRQRIEEMDMPKTEEMVMGIVKRELKFVEIVGAILGAFIGVINASL